MMIAYKRTDGKVDRSEHNSMEMNTRNVTNVWKKWAPTFLKGH